MNFLMKRYISRACKLSAQSVIATSLLVLGCTMQSSTDVAQNDAEPFDASFDDTTTTDAADITPAVTERILSLKQGKIDRTTSATGDIFAIIAPIKNGTYETLALTAPPRVVVDVKGLSAIPAESIELPGATVAERVRIGSHPGKTRFVFDIKEGAVVEHSVVETAEGLQIALSLANSDLRGQPKPEAVFAPEIANQVDEAKLESDREEQIARDAAIAAAAENAAADERLALEEAAVEEKTIAQSQKVEAMQVVSPEVPIAPVAKKSNTFAQLRNLSLEQLDGSDNMMLAELSSKVQYTFERTAPSEYVLTLQNTTLNDSTLQTLIAPPNAGSIRSVRTVAQGSRSLVRIFTKPEVTLTAEAQGTSLMVLAAEVPGNFGRAQAAPESLTSVATDESVKSIFNQKPQYTGRLISLDLQDTDIDNALRIIAEVSNLNIIASDDVQGKVTLRLVDVPWDQALDVILKTNGLDKVSDGNVVRIAPVDKLRAEREALKQAQQAEEELEPLKVRYLRVSYARSSELKPLVETVLSERGSITYDERTNQLIVKDIQKGLENVAELVSKVDLRTPQVLLETQIVEATRSIFRDLGTELGFTHVQSPATGNATSYNFPNSITIGGSLPNGSASAFGAAVTGSEGSAVSLLFGSADGTHSLSTRLTALEKEGRVRIVSRPSVATTNNKEALIKSIEKIRVKTPDGGVSVGVGAGSSASGSSTTATEAIEVGITLEVTPQASPDYWVLLDVNAKSSSFGSRTVDGIPSEIERSANSTILVSSGQTFAMGGIYKLTDRDTLSGIPFLKDIPFLGTLFRRSLIDNGDEELLFFITPRIIEGSFDDAAMKS